MTSLDGITWTARESPADNNWMSVKWAPELSIFVAVAWSGSGNRVMTSAIGMPNSQSVVKALPSQVSVDALGNMSLSGSISTGNMGMFRNGVINGDMRIWQRGTTFAIANSAAKVYTADRWMASQNNTSAMIVSRQAITDNKPFQYCLRVQRNTGSTALDGMRIVQALESAESLSFAGKSATLSFYLRRGSGFSSTFSVNLICSTGNDQDPNLISGGNWINQTGFINVNIANALISTSWSRFTYIVSMPSTCNQIGIQFSKSNAGQADGFDFIDMTGVQLELGTIATPFEFRPYAIELQLCQRYYEAIGNIILHSRYIGGAGFNHLFHFVYFNTKKRSNAGTVTVNGNWHARNGTLTAYSTSGKYFNEIIYVNNFVLQLSAVNTPIPFYEDGIFYAGLPGIIWDCEL
jgi:hypothetical protein